MQFISPGLTTQERQLAIPFFCLSAVFLTLGICVAYYVTIPFANHSLWNFNAAIGQNLWSLSNYLNFTLFLFFSHALAFEIALFFLVLVHVRVLTKEWMIKKRKFMILGAFILGALLTPPDIFSQLLMALLLMTLYECALFYAWWRER
jgi:sec-independent protein translocase protein TatC